MIFDDDRLYMTQMFQTQKGSADPSVRPSMYGVYLSTVLGLAAKNAVRTSVNTSFDDISNHNCGYEITSVPS